MFWRRSSERSTACRNPCGGSPASLSRIANTTVHACRAPLRFQKPPENVAGPSAEAIRAERFHGNSML
jgi:hypothetical protein